MKNIREYRSPDGISWKVDVRLPSHSSAMLTFSHPDGQSSKQDRYAWINSEKVTDLRERLVSKDVLDQLSDADLARLFRRSMSISSNRN